MMDARLADVLMKRLKKPETIPARVPSGFQMGGELPERAAATT